MIEAYQTWRKRRRAIREARLLLREGRRGLRKYSHRLTDKATVAVREAIDSLSKITIDRTWDELPGALNALDRALDDYLPFARKSTLREYTESIAVAVLIALFLRAFVVEAFKIPSGSMIPTLQVGDHIFVNKFIYGIRMPWSLDLKFGMSYRKPRRGEVIVFIYPKETDKDFIKRIVAVEGDTVEVRDNVLVVNNKPVARKHLDGCGYYDYDEPSLRWEERRGECWSETLDDGTTYTTVFDKNGPTRSSPPQHVPPNSVFVMGDNRDNSHDSRFWGFVPFGYIKGKAMVIWWSSGEPEGWIRLARMFKLVR